MTHKSRQNNSYKIIEATEVRIPSSEFPHVPYYVYLLEDNFKKRILWKSTKKYNQHNRILFSQKTATKKYHIGVVGSGITGSGIAATALLASYSTVIFVRTSASHEQVRNTILHQLISMIGVDNADKRMGLLTITSSWDSLKQVDVVIEAIVENTKEKQKVLSLIEKYVSSKAIIATNTSSLSISTLATVLAHPSRFIGMHFFNPVTKMRLVEIMKCKKTSQSTAGIVQRIALDFGKTPIVLNNEIRGYIVNRLLFRMASEALDLFSNKVASISDIDTAVESGLNHPIGPFKLMDLIGLDVSYEILKNLEFKNDTPSNSSLLYEYIKKGKTGRKSGVGFYTYQANTVK